MAIKKAEMHPIPKAKMDRAGLQELVRNGLEIDKKGVRIFIPRGKIVFCGATRKMAQFFFAGYTPERPMQYGNDIRRLAPFFSLGVIDYNMETERWVQDSIRFVRFKRDKISQEKFLHIRDEILGWLARKIGVEQDEF